MSKKNYDLELYSKKSKKSDCNIILDDVEGVFGSIGTCFDTIVDEKKSKMQVAGSFFGFLGSTTKLLWHGTGCAVKHTPKAVATVVAVKRELTETITEEHYKYQKEQKEMELEAQIKKIAASTKKDR